MMTLLFLVALIIVAAILIAHAIERAQAINATYTTTVGRHRFDFEFVPLSDGTVRLYVLGQPSYGHQSTDLVATHRYYDGDRHYVCVHDHLAPRNCSEARGWADYWSRKTSAYIADGRPFA